MINLIESYTKNSIKLSDGTELNGNIIIIETNHIQYKEDNISIEGLSFLKNINTNKDILLIGCGEKFTPPSFEIKKYVHELGFKLEWTTTKSAIHIFNIIKEDQRDMIAIFINK